MPIHGYPGNIVTANPTAPTVNSASGVWTTEQALQNIANWPMPLQQIARSLRFNSADSASLTRTPSVTGNRKTWTWSGWVKRGKLSTTQDLFGTVYTSGGTNDQTYLRLESNDKIGFVIYDSAGGYSALLATTQVLRDPSAWYHIVLILDTTQATSTDRVKVYVNGGQVTSFSTSTYPAQNKEGYINLSGREVGVGNTPPTGTSYYDGYLTEINFIDGLALDPSYFGFFDANGIWQPRAYKGAYGTNGFFLNFSDNSGTTSTTLGKDYSGNGNNFTPNNFSVTAGAGNDSLVDSPTNYGTDTGAGGEVRGNYATWNGVSIGADATLTNGNLDIAYGSSGTRNATMGTFGMSSGKWYWEVTITATSTSPAHAILGITNNSSASAVSSYPGAAANGWGYYANDGDKYNNGSGAAYGASFTTNDVIGFAFDADAGSITAYKNGVSQGVMFSSLAANTYYPAIGDGSSGSTFSSSANFGQRPFAYTAPSGFKALCTQNLPEPTIADGGDYFNTVLYTGNGSTQSITGVGFEPDFVWSKSRSNATFNILFDRLRLPNALASDLTNAEGIENNLSSLDSNGFTFSSAGNYDNVNARTYVAWNWKANGAGSTNTAGTITSTVSVNTTSGFSIVTYTGNGSAGATVGHGLGVAPKFIIVKSRSIVDGWLVYSSELGATKYLVLNATNAAGTLTAAWNDTAPTSTVFSIGTNSAVNQSSATYVAYCFAPVAGYSAFGSYVGNGSADGPFVYTGFRPAYVMYKSTSTSQWGIFDDARNTYNAANLLLQANTANAEGDNTATYDFLSNGFKVRIATFEPNKSGETYIYAAFAENPFKISRAR